MSSSDKQKSTIKGSEKFSLPSKDRIYLCIDLKSFYASVECVERGLDPLTARLLVADDSRSDATICLAVSPALKALGVPGRPRLFEAKQKIREAEIRTGRKIDYITAVPQMAKYTSCTARIYGIYLKYIAPEDIHVYSVDEVFIDITDYLPLYRMTPHELAMTMVRDVLSTTGITATCGIGTNMYLAKVAMDIVAKRMEADADGVRIAELTPMSYRLLLWDHMPLTDFWQIGGGTSRTLSTQGIFTMGDIATMSLTNEELFYQLFGINAELLIDHAWGLEPCTMPRIKTFTPVRHSVQTGQVLPKPYDYEKAGLIIREMADELCVELVSKNLVTDSIVIHIGYDYSSCDNAFFQGAFYYDYLGRKTPKHTGGTIRLGTQTNSAMRIIPAAWTFYRQAVNRQYYIRRVSVTAQNVIHENDSYFQYDLFTDPALLEKEKRLQRAIASIRSRYGRNAVLRGLNLLDDARTRERNTQIGGHRA